MKNLKLGLKIGMGFGILILISCALGGLAVWNMSSVEHDAERLAKAYVPEVAVSNQVERGAQQVMYAIRGYGFTENAAFLDEGKKWMGELQKALSDADALAQAQGLPALRENVQVARGHVNEYTSLVERTTALIQAMHGDRERMDASAAQFMQNAAEFLTSDLVAHVPKNFFNLLI